MGHILLVILKFIGLFLGSLLGLILALILIVLFAPFSYRAEGEAEEGTKKVQARVSWLFAVITGRIRYDDNGLLWSVRILGFLFAGNDKEFLEKKARKKEKKAKKEKAKSKTQESQTIKKVPGKAEEKSASEGKSPTRENLPASPDLQKPKETVSKKKEERLDQVEEKKKESLRQKIERVFSSLKDKIRMLRDKVQSLKEKKEQIEETILAVRVFFAKPETKRVKDRLFLDGKKMLLHILPRKFSGHVEFGLSDPCQMGQILAILGMLIPIYQDHLTVCPDFEEEKLCGSFFLKGRIIPGYLIGKGLVLFLNKEVRNTIKEGKQLIGGNKDGSKKRR